MASVLRLKPGTIIGRDFRITRLLAKGGMGAVYVAEQLSTASERALKVMHPQLLEDAKSRERFTQEARICARIESDHVVKVIGAGIDEALETPWIAMELIKGEELEAVVKSRGALPKTEVLEIFRQLCHGLGAAHRIGVVHRDLKLGNILIAESQRSDAPFTVKVLDFGISKVIQEQQTDTTAAVGSPMWMAPEQAQKGKLGPATDIWPLGLIAFRLLTGKFYWRAANSAHAAIKEVLIDLLVAPLATASARAEEVGGIAPPPGFDAWFARCVVRNPDGRFRSAAECLDALVPVLSGGSPFRGPSLWGFPPAGAAPGPHEVPTPVAALSPAPRSPAPRSPAPPSPAPPSPAPPSVAPGPATAVGAAQAPRSSATPGPAAAHGPDADGAYGAASSTTGGVTIPRGVPRARGGALRWVGLGAVLSVVGVTVGAAALRHYGGGRTTGDSGTALVAAPTDAPVPLGDVTAVALGGGSTAGGHTCARLTDGTVRCWGGDTFGQVGDGAVAAARPRPVTVVDLSGVAGLTAGAGHTCAVLTDGTARCWGRNEFGELGDGTTENRARPVAVAGLAGVAEVGAGENHTCARMSDGTVQCWGQNEFGQLGDGTTATRPTPAAVHGIAGATGLAVGGNNACAVLAGGVVRCWGRNSYGELGDGTTESRSESVAVLGIVGASQVALGAQHGCARLADGTARCWGQNHYGQLGDGSTTNRPTAVTVAGLAGAVSLGAGENHTCARTADGAVRCWGSNQHGQLGDGSTIHRAAPVTVAGLSTVEDVALGRNHGCARLSDRTLRCWGENEYGELGDGSTGDRHQPVAVRR